MNEGKPLSQYEGYLDPGLKWVRDFDFELHDNSWNSADSADLLSFRPFEEFMAEWEMNTELKSLLNGAWGYIVAMESRIELLKIQTAALKIQIEQAIGIMHNNIDSIGKPRLEPDGGEEGF